MVSVAVGLGVLLAAGCQSSRICVNADQKRIMGQLARIDPDKETLPQETRIIDVHTHTFNARYLPLRGILLGKRDALFPITTLISDSCAKTVAQALVNCTELASGPNRAAIERHPDTKRIRETAQPGWLCRVFLSIIDDAVKSGVWNSEKSLDEQLTALDQMAAHMSVVQKLAVRAAANMMGMQKHVKGGKEGSGTITGTQSFMRFLWILTQNDEQMTKLFRDMHRGAPMKGPITMISHMMDLAPVYDQPADGEALLDFPTQQVRRMERYQNAPQSHLVYFVAYTPYRDYPPAGQPMNALQVVQDAIQHHGAKGVKIYPPSGYRPFANDIKIRPWAISRYPGEQWDARYGGLGEDRDKALDDEMNVLLEWCISNDVPVLVHSGYGEFEARRGYGEYHSNPEYWRQFLEAHSRPGHPCTLRLCLGHAGGEDYWFGTGTHADWGQCVYQLCTNYPNVYCEITTSAAMIEPTTQAHFVDQVSRLFAESSTATYPFATKLMYGTDWPLPDKGEPAAVLRATEQAFLHPLLVPHYADYFSGNAIRFLNSDPD